MPGAIVLHWTSISPLHINIIQIIPHGDSQMPFKAAAHSTRAACDSTARKDARTSLSASFVLPSQARELVCQAAIKRFLCRVRSSQNQVFSDWGLLSISSEASLHLDWQCQLRCVPGSTKQLPVPPHSSCLSFSSFPRFPLPSSAFNCPQKKGWIRMTMHIWLISAKTHSLPHAWNSKSLNCALPSPNLCSSPC